MEKISTLFRKDPNDLGRVIHETNPENEWVFNGFGIATRKYDGTACAIIEDELYKRYDAKINKKTGKRKEPPAGSIACQEPDEITGHQPYWAPCDRNNPADKWHWQAFDIYIKNNLKTPQNGTYELCGPKIQGNPEGFDYHELIPHGLIRCTIPYKTWDGIKTYLELHDIEGIVFHHISDGRMCKIRKSDFGIKR